MESAPPTHHLLARLPPEHALPPDVLAALADPRPPAQPYRTVEDVLKSAPLELAEACRCSPHVALDIIRKASRKVCPEPTTVRSLLLGNAAGCSGTATMPPFFKTGHPALDHALRGGIPCSSITEFAGPAGCGKTQICTTLAVLATLPRAMGGLDGAVAYIDTEGAFSPQRLVEIARARFPEHFDSSFATDIDRAGWAATDAGDAVRALSDSVHILRARSSKELSSCFGCLQELIIGRRVRLVVVDSIAALVRKEFSVGLHYHDSELKNRNDLLSKDAALLKYIAESFRIPVVVTNQITTRIQRTPIRRSHDTPSPHERNAGVGAAQITAALGNTWSHSVNTRLFLEFAESEYQPGISAFYKSTNADLRRPAPHPRARNIHIAKSPVAPPVVLQFTVTPKGFTAIQQPTPTAEQAQGRAGR